jgi:hypothetical protein
MLDGSDRIGLVPRPREKAEARQRSTLFHRLLKKTG